MPNGSFDSSAGQPNGLNLGAQSYRGNSPVNLYLGHSSPDAREHHYKSKDREVDYSTGRGGDSPRLGTSDSPDLGKQRQEHNQSPGESSRSYSSQRNEDNLLGGYHSPNNDSVGSRSPENLSSATSYGINNNNTSKFNSHLNDMLDHKLQLSFLGPPLAALHSMTEMKGQNSPNAPQGAQVASNPHGIDTILSRPPPVTSAGLNALASGESDAFYFIRFSYSSAKR